MQPGFRNDNNSIFDAFRGFKSMEDLARQVSQSTISGALRQGNPNMADVPWRENNARLPVLGSSRIIRKKPLQTQKIGFKKTETKPAQYKC